MKPYLLTLCLLAVALPAGADSVPNRAEAAPAPLMLTVTLDTIYNPHFQVRLPVTVNKPFRIQTTNGAVTNTISGTVSGPVRGKYALPLFVSEWASAASNISGTEQFHLELDKPQSGGPTASFVYMRTVSLSKAVSAPN